MPENPVAAPVCVRLRFTPEEAKKLAVVQRFLNLPSLSQTAARLALWNASILSASLASRPVEDAVGDVFGDVAKLAARSAVRELVSGGGSSR